MASEITHHTDWANACNLKLNATKTQEIVFCRRNCKLPLSTLNIERVSSIKILGVIVDDKLKFQDHINSVVSNTSQCYFALRTLKHHGMTNTCLQNIFRATVVPKMLYAIPSFWGFLTQAQRNQMQSVLNRAIKLNYYTEDDPTVEQFVNKQESDLYRKITDNPQHILHYLLPTKHKQQHDLRKERVFSLPDKDERQLVNRLLYKNL